MFFRTLKLEIHIHRNRLAFLVAGSAFLALFACLSFYSMLYLQSSPQSRSIPSFWDQLTYFYMGAAPFNIENEISFQIPIAYFMQHLLFLLTLGGTTEYYFEPYGYEIFTRLPQRQLWWYAHTSFCLLASVLYCLTVMIVTAFFCLSTGAGFSLDSYTGFSRPMIVSWPGPNFIQLFTIFLTPPFVWCGMGMLLQVIELLLGSLPAVLALLGFVIAGAFLGTPLLFANHTMLIRSASFLGNGSTLFQTCSICISVIVVSWIIGLIVLSHKDILV